MRVLIFAAYDGTNYKGWQKQEGFSTVQGELEDAIEKFTGRKTEVIGASRTDSGVHSAGSAAVFDIDIPIPGEKIAFALNTYLPEDIRIMRSLEVPGDFHPRHTDTIKTYSYRIVSAKIADPRTRLYAMNVHVHLDTALMQKAASYLEGEHDFRSFANPDTEVTDFVRTIYNIDVNEKKLDLFGDSSLIEIRVRGNGFLYNMVRIIAGSLIEVGRGKIKPEDLKIMLERKDRRFSGPTAPALGLSLERIEFPELEKICSDL
jgi:tRNA pseudouridine38-40 synthase